MLVGVTIQHRGHAPEARLGGVGLGRVGAGSGRGRRRSEEDEAEQPDRFDEEPFEGVGAQKTTSVSGDNNVARSQPQLVGWRTCLDVADMIDCVID